MTKVGCVIFVVYDNVIIVVLTLCELTLSNISVTLQKQALKVQAFTSRYRLEYSFDALRIQDIWEKFTCMSFCLLYLNHMIYLSTRKSDNLTEYQLNSKCGTGFVRHFNKQAANIKQVTF